MSNSIITKRRKGTVDDPFIQINESHIVENDKVVLTEIPDKFTKVKVKDKNNVSFYEVTGGIPKVNEFYVDYDNKLVTFSSTHNGEQFNFEYKGTGLHYVPTSIIYTKTSEGEVVETLGKIIDEGRDGIDVIYSINDKFAELNASEDVRKQNEIDRNSNESVRNQKEIERETNENTRIQNENKRQQDTQEALELVSSATSNAQTQATFAKEQGDYAKREADRLVGTDVSVLDNKIGNLTELNTSEKSNLVKATNEISSQLAQTGEQLAQTENNLTFAKVENKQLSTYGTNEPIIIDTLNDGYLYGRISSTLYRKKKLSDSWELVRNLNAGDAITGIRLAGDGEVLVACAAQGIWKSSGWANNPLTATFSRKLVTNGTVRQYGFSADVISGWVLVTTYINGDMSNSRYVWLSKDRGNTFQQVFDMDDYEPGINHVHAHMHIALVDSYHSPTTPRLWISYHKTNSDPTESSDPIKRIKYSDDGGNTWQSLTDSKYQPVCAVALPNGVVFGDDIDDMGVYFVKRESDPSKMKYEWIYAIRDTFPGIFGWGTKAIVDENGIAHIAFRTSIAGYSARIISTDGVKVAETARIEPATPTDSVDLVDIVAFQGKLLGTYYNTATGGGVGYKFISDLPKRGLNLEGYETLGNMTGGIASGAGGFSSGFGAESGHKGTAIGFQAKSLRDGFAGGHLSLAHNEGTAIGRSASTTDNGVSIGYNASATEGVSVGRNSKSVVDGIAIGGSAEAIAEGQAIGLYAKATGAQSTAIGKTTVASGLNSIALGNLAQATATGAISLGRNARATHEHSIAIGWGVQSTSSNQLRIGTKHIELNNIANPSTFPTSGLRLFSRVNGSGKIEFCVLFPTGSPVVVASEV